MFAKARTMSLFRFILILLCLTYSVALAICTGTSSQFHAHSLPTNCSQVSLHFVIASFSALWRRGVLWKGQHRWFWWSLKHHFVSRCLLSNPLDCLCLRSIYLIIDIPGKLLPKSLPKSLELQMQEIFSPVTTANSLFLFWKPCNVHTVGLDLLKVIVFLIRISSIFTHNLRLTAQM